MPRIKLTKSAIDSLPTPKSDVVYWDAGVPGFGVKVTPKGRLRKMQCETVQLVQSGLAWLRSPPPTFARRAR
jgi:hypothetical protein